MATTYLAMLKYTAEGVKGIGAARTTEVKEAIKRVGGKFLDGYELLGRYDAMIIAEYPDEKAAIKATIALNKLIGVTSDTMVAIQIDEFDQDLACYL